MTTEAFMAFLKLDNIPLKDYSFASYQVHNFEESKRHLIQIRLILLAIVDSLPALSNLILFSCERVLMSCLQQQQQQNNPTRNMRIILISSKTISRNYDRNSNNNDNEKRIIKNLALQSFLFMSCCLSSVRYFLLFS